MENLCEQAIDIYLKTCEALDPAAAINRRLSVSDGILFADGHRLNLSDYSEIKIIGFGKASLIMGSAIETLLSGRVTEGMLVTNRRGKGKADCEVIIAGHPLPDENSLIAGARILEMIQESGPDTLIFFLISGGGSALVEYPLFDEVTLEDLKELNHVLVTCGASIQEINLIRKHLSKIKGGRLGYLARRSNWIALYISDVNEGDILSLASNPLLVDGATLSGFQQIVERLDLIKHLPPTLGSAIEAGRVPPLPSWKPVEGLNQISVMLMENSDAVTVASRVARELGFEVRTEKSLVEGNYRDIADRLVARLCGIRNGEAKGACLISGGEVSCAVKGDGLGGRNQEFALYAASRMAEAGIEHGVALSCGTDGIDGNSLSTGAAIPLSAMREAERCNKSLVEYFDASDTHSFILEFGGLVVTGPTGTNVRDLRILLAH